MIRTSGRFAPTVIAILRNGDRHQFGISDQHRRNPHAPAPRWPKAIPGDCRALLATPAAPYTVVVLSGLRIEELQIGDGAVASRGARVTVRYSGFLNRGEPFQTDVVTTFAVGGRNTIAGLSWGVEGMRVGGRRRLRVGPHLAYRDKGVPGLIPPNAKLVFEVELLTVG